MLLIWGGKPVAVCREAGITEDDRAILSLKNQRIKLEKERKRVCNWKEG